jgi:chorismate mutase-like protein
MTAAPNDLAALRREIDTLDDRLHDLLMQRAALVERVQAAKADSTGLFLRPGREAQIVRRLLARHSGPLRPAAVARIWREMLGGLYHLQGGLTVAVFGGAAPVTLWDAARGHFGAATPMSLHEDMPAVLGVVNGNRATVGVLPAPEEGESDPWWVHLRGEAPGTPRVVARLPFVVTEARHPASGYVIAGVAPEPSGNDVTLIAATVAADKMSRQRMLDVLTATGLAAAPLSHAVAGGEQVLLVEVAGFVAADDARLRDFARDTTEASGRAVAIGAYAAPVHYPAA